MGSWSVYSSDSTGAILSFVRNHDRIRNSEMNLILSICVLCALTSNISALRCYSCEGKDNDSCVSNPTSTKIKECSYNEQCYTRTKQNDGGRVSVKRGCSSSVSASSSSFGGGSASAWSQSCSSDLCNSNDGRTISFSMPDMNAFNVFKGFNGDSQAAFSNRKSNAASGNTSQVCFDGFYRCFGGDIELHNAKLGRS